MIRFAIISLIAPVSVFATNNGWSGSYAGTGNGCISGGTCYYIDYVGGSDSNNGLSTGTAWKSVPGMACATGNAASHTFGQTNEFILKGGVTWPAACFPWTISGGSAGTANGYAYPGMYVGYDPAWHSGTLVAIRVTDPGSCAASTTFSVSISGGGGTGATATAQVEIDPYAEGDLQYVTVTGAGSGFTSNPTISLSVTAGSCTALPTAYADIYSPVMDAGGTVFGNSSTIPPMFTFSPTRGTVDHIEFKNYLWYAGGSYSGGSPVVIYSSGGLQVFRNLYVHNFGMNGSAVAANLVGARNAAQTSGLYGTGQTAGSALINSVFNNYESEARGCDNGGLAVSCTANTAVYDMAIVTNNIINAWRAGVYTLSGATSGYLVAGNKMWAILCDPATQHPDAFYLLGGTIAYNNILRDIWSGTAAFYVEVNEGTAPVSKGMTSYLFNNVLFGKGTNGSGTSTPPIGWTAEFTSASATSLSPAPDLRSYNNTFYSYSGNSACMNAGQWFGNSPALSASFPFTLKNNHCVSSQSTGHWYASDYGIWNGQSSPNGPPAQTAIDPTATIQSPATATSQGYAQSNNFSPTTSTDDTVTFAAGAGTANLTSLCSTTVGGISLAPLCEDINGVARPSSGGWQSGAYHFQVQVYSTVRSGSTKTGGAVKTQ